MILFIVFLFIESVDAAKTFTLVDNVFLYIGHCAGERAYISAHAFSSIFKKDSLADEGKKVFFQ